jgi:uncharacterized glyoxalase superfamily protein PhnB
MLIRVTHISLLVSNQDEALKWYTEILEFEPRSDRVVPNSSDRWLTISPKNQPELEIILQPLEWGLGGSAAARADLIGQAPGWVIVTDDCQADYEKLKSRGVEFISPPAEQPWGISAVFNDLYGTQHNLLQPYPG